MTKSIGEQLKALKAKDPIDAIPVVTDKVKSLPSLVFDPNEAATLDEAVILEVGRSGMNDLVAMDPLGMFPWQERFFDHSELERDRALLSVKEDAELNDEIRRFLRFLSPFFDLNACHRALEWMIRKFRIQIQNVDACMDCILPWLEREKAAIRMLQIMRFDEESALAWHFLSERRRDPTPIGKGLLALRMKKDPGLLQVMLDNVLSQSAKHFCQRPPQVLWTSFTLIVMEWIQMSSPDMPLTEQRQCARVIQACLTDEWCKQCAQLQLVGYSIGIFLANAARGLDKQLSKDIVSAARHFPINPTSAEDFVQTFTDQ